jgi:phenylpropionate dioxygenase-like ring-hydroxylating dioxygenase large terminal subunit
MEFDFQLFRDYWHLICHRNELPANGDFLKLDTPLGDLVIFNDSGDLVAFDNLCPHRGARMFAGREGNQAATCSYHGWSYNNGRMVIPMVSDFHECTARDAKLNKYQTDWCGDFLFVAVSPRTPLYDQLGGVAEVLENISFNISGRLDFNTYQFQSYWPIAVENALEPYHIPLVHTGTLATLGLGDGVNEYHGENSIWRAPVGNARIHKQLHSLGKQFAIDYSYEGYMSIYLFPFTMISSTFGYSYSLQNFFPHAREGETTSFSSRLLTVHAAGERAAAILGPFLNSSAKVNRQVFEEDHAVCKLVPKESWSTEPLKFASRMEEKISHFRTSCRNYLGTTSA